VEPALLVVGLNYRTAPVGVRERFWIGESRRYEALIHLTRAEGIEEVLVMATCNRTEFWLWASDVTLAANSVMRLLGAEYGLKLCEWKHFYRLLDEDALLHIFRVASSLDSMVVGEPQVVEQVKDAWLMAQKIGATARFLDAVLQKALTVSKRVRTETAIGHAAVSIPYAAVELARKTLRSLEGKKVLLLGAGKMGELSARGLMNHGKGSVQVTVINRTLEHAFDLAAKLGAQAVAFDDRWKYMAEADIIISSTSCPHTILTREEAEVMMRERLTRERMTKREPPSAAGNSVAVEDRGEEALPEDPAETRPLVIVDIAMPRDIDPAVRDVEGIYLYDLDDLEVVADHNAAERVAAAIEAQKILHAEAQGFRHKLMSERVVPTIVALRSRLDEICRQELDSFKQESGPFSKDQDEMLNAILSRMTQRIAGSLARELKELPEKVQQEQMTTALQRLFHLQPAEKAIAGTKSA
jgi:glutamyl-tRNA reductase